LTQTSHTCRSAAPYVISGQARRWEAAVPKEPRVLAGVSEGGQHLLRIAAVVTSAARAVIVR
jgi:hypothetical protein